jgi:hypothetical protein
VHLPGIPICSVSDSRPVRGLFVSGDFFRVLGVSPQLGRVFTRGEDLCGVPGDVLSHAFWQSEFAAGRAILGRKIILNQQAVEVVGVTGPRVRGSGNRDRIRRRRTDLLASRPLECGELAR